MTPKNLAPALAALLILSGCKCFPGVLYPATLDNILAERTDPTNVESDRMLSPENGLWIAFCARGQGCVMRNSHWIGSTGSICTERFAREVGDEVIRVQRGRAVPLRFSWWRGDYYPAAWRCYGEPWRKIPEASHA